MRKALCSIWLFLVLLAMTACGGREQKLSYRLEQEQKGLSVIDTMTMEAKGDKVTALQEVIELDMSAFDEDLQATLSEMYQALVAQYGEIEGVECTGEKDQGVYTIQILVDTSGEAVPRLAEAGLMQIEGDAEGISLENTAKALEESGYILVE